MRLGSRPGAAHAVRHAGVAIGARARVALRLFAFFLCASPLAGLLLAPSAAQAQARAGEVEQVRGVVVAQFPGEPPRSLATGAPLREGEQLQSAPASSAVLRLDDGTRLTLRPDTRLVLRTWRYKAQAAGQEPVPDNALVVDLLRGGLRAVTGLVTRSGPDAARIQTQVGAIGIRGTDLHARLCQGEPDCVVPGRGPKGQGGQGERAGSRQGAPTAAPPTSARVLRLEGIADAIDLLDRRRRLVPGASVYPGDRVATGPGSHLVLAFRDGSRMTLGAASELRIDEYRYDAQSPQEGRMLMTVLRGTLRALTGLIARADPRHVTFNTPTATLGIRGTGFDLACLGDCVDGRRTPAEADWLRVCTWRGAVDMRPPDQEVADPVVEGDCAALGPGGVQALAGPLGVGGPRPDGLDVPASFFSQASLPDPFEGLLVFVDVGGVRLYGPGGYRDLGNGEGGYSTNTELERLDDTSGLRDQMGSDAQDPTVLIGPKPPICTR